MTTIETPLSQAKIKCANCDRVLETWDQWFCEPCGSDPLTGHSLKRKQIMLLKFRLEETK